MSNKPAAERVIDEDVVRELLREQYPTGTSLPLRHAADGWDCSVWRLGPDLAVRVPRRGLAAPLVSHEQRWLPAIAARVAPTGVAVPAPVFAGSPTQSYPWPWSIVPWIDGEPGLAITRSQRAGWTGPLAAVLEALHMPAPTDHPINPFRGVPLADRADALADHLRTLRPTGARLESLELAWERGLAAEPWRGPALWIHGDLHPGNLVATGSRLTGMIDFGDITAGDPAYDLAIAWLAFDAPARAAFIAACGPRVDDATWTRARAWAASVTLILLSHSDDNPRYAELGLECLAELA